MPAAVLRRKARRVCLRGGSVSDAARRPFYLCSGSGERRRGGNDDGSGSSSGPGASFFLFHGGFPVFVASDCSRLVVIFLFAIGKDLFCSPVGSPFRVGIFDVGGGFAAGLLFLCGGSFSFIFGWPWCPLETSPPLSLPLRSPMLVQRHRSALTGGLGWWLLRFNHDLGSAGGVFGGSCFDSCGSKLVQDIVAVSVAQQVGPVAMRTMNRISRDLSVISSFYGVLFVKGDVLCSSLIYLPFRKKKRLHLNFFHIFAITATT